MLAISGPAIGQQSSMPVQQRPLITNGPVVGEGQNYRNLYLLRCAGCHGRDGEGTAWDWPKLGPALKGNPFVQNAPASAIIRVIRKGRSGRERLYHESYPNMKECGSCHIAYSPQLLPARSWMRVMGNLADHFGESATVDAATQKRILDYLTAHSAESGSNEQSVQIMRHFGHAADSCVVR